MAVMTSATVRLVRQSLTLPPPHPSLPQGRHGWIWDLTTTSVLPAANSFSAMALAMSLATYLSGIASTERCSSLSFAAVAGPIFVWRSLTYRQPIVELRAFGNRNFLVGFVMTFTVGFALFGGTFLLPLFLGRVREYSSSEVGTTMVVSGLAMFATAPFAGRLVRRMDARILMFGGFMLCAWGMWEARVVTDDWGFWNFASVQAFRGVGVMLAMIASQQVTMATLPPHMVKNASGLVNLSRNVGGAFGLAILNTGLTTNTAIHMGELTSSIAQGDQAMRNMMAGMAQRFAGTIDPAAPYAFSLPKNKKWKVRSAGAGGMCFGTRGARRCIRARATAGTDRAVGRRHDARDRLELPTGRRRVAAPCPLDPGRRRGLLDRLLGPRPRPAEDARAPWRPRLGDGVQELRAGGRRLGLDRLAHDAAALFEVHQMRLAVQPHAPACGPGDAVDHRAGRSRQA